VTKKFQDLDMCDPKTHDDPWEMLEYLRENDPLYWDPHNEVWYVFRYDDIVEVSRDPETFTSTEGNRPHLPPDPSMIHQDGETHRKQRGLVAQGFSPKYIRQQEPHIREIAIELIERCIPEGRMDLVADLAAPLPMRVIGDMLGVPREKHSTILGWIDKFLQGGMGPQYVDDAVNEAFGEFCVHHEEMLELIGENPQGDDLLNRWLRAELEGEKLTEDQLLFEHTLLNVGGAETTRSAISGGLEELARNPEQYELLRQKLDDREFVENACEEIIRWVTPFHNMFRTATRDVEMHGKVIKEGQMIGLQYPAANRDPRHFKDPYKFDITREFDTKHISFGYGSHFCLGASLARMELRVSLEEFISRIKNLRLDPASPPVWVSSSFVRGPKSTPVLIERR
jgi:cholest-4-en-3-one 26-monooxygenase